MAKSTQSRIADWTNLFACGSAVVPIIGMFALFGIGSVNIFWLTCFGLAVFAGITFWILHRLEKDEYPNRIQGWIISIIYFITVFLVVLNFFESLFAALIIGFPEVAGFLISTVGLFHSFYISRAEPVAGGDAAR